MTQIPVYGIVRLLLDSTGIHVDEFGTVRFSLFRNNGHVYNFEQEAESDLLFVTLRDENGRAVGKQVINTAKLDNKEIVEIYQDYLKEQTDDAKRTSSDDK